MLVTLTDVEAAREQIAEEIIRTPLVLCDSASEGAGIPVYLKLENLQRIGAFKVRGALAKVASLASFVRAAETMGLEWRMPRGVLAYPAWWCFLRTLAIISSRCSKSTELR